MDEITCNAPLKRNLIEKRDYGEKSKSFLGVHKESVVSISLTNVQALDRIEYSTMSALSFALPFSGFLYMLGKPTILEIPDPGKVTSVPEDLNNHHFDAPTETYKKSEENEPELRFLFPSLDPTTIPTSPATNRDASKAESKYPLSFLKKKIQLDNRVKWSQGSNERKASNELAIEEERAKSVVSKNTVTDEGKRKDATVRLYVSDVKDTLKDRFAKGSMQLGVDVGAATRTDADKANTSTVDNRAKRKRSYIRLCKRLTGSAGSSQKPRGKDCVKFPRSEFYVEQGSKRKEESEKDGSLVGLQRTNTDDGKNYKDPENGSYDGSYYKQWDGAVKPL